ncbi:MAG: MMPL family transporter, partial [Thermoproteota archaeon]
CNLVKKINIELYSLKNNITNLNSKIYNLIFVINSTSQIAYGIPLLYLKIWLEVYNETHGGFGNIYFVNNQANYIILNKTNYFNRNNLTLAYYNIFINVWNNTFESFPNINPTDRLMLSLNKTFQIFINNPYINNQTKQIFILVFSKLSLSNWNNTNSIVNLALNYTLSLLPSNIFKTITNEDFIKDIYNLGKNPSEDAVKNLTISIFEKELGNLNITGYSENYLILKSYEIGMNASYGKIWNLTSQVASNITLNLFKKSPTFNINNESLYETLLLINKTCCVDIQKFSYSIVLEQNFSNLPLTLKYSVTKSFVSPDNTTMFVLLNFNSNIDSQTLKEVETIVNNSKIDNETEILLTGGPIISRDVSKSFSDTLDISRFVGTLTSMLVVGLLFLSPVAAIVPYIIAGIAIVIAYPLIYYLVVAIGHQQLTFLTPVLTSLLMLGLSIDYSVLQMRRTKEEISKGKDKYESVSISFKWAGLAILTAGITVIVSYTIMSLSNIPLFGDVGYSIAIGVFVLLLAALTFLPALQYEFGDKLFWPSRRYESVFSKTKVLDKVSKSVLKKKSVIILLVSLIAIGSFFVVYSTSLSMDLIKAVPSFKSIQAINIIDQKIGSGSIQPTYIIIKTSSPLMINNTTPNSTIFNEINDIINAIKNVNGVSYVAGPSQPYGENFNYSNLNSYTEPVQFQYISAVKSYIGKDNKTALIYVWLNDEATSKNAVNYLISVENKVSELLSSGNFKDISQVYFGGSTQVTYDTELIYNQIIPQVIVTLSLAILAILFIQLRSLFIPLRLVVTILISITVSLAILDIIFYIILGYPITNFIPLFVAVTMLGVGIDYDIFFVTRIRELVLNGKRDEEAIVEAINKVSGTLIGLGLIFASVFASVILSDIIIVREIGFVVALAIILDTSALLLFFVPAIMALIQRYNWWPSKVSK